MAPSAPHISTQLRQLIYYQLDNNCIRNALFLAGRLHAFEPRSSEASYLLALCYLQSGHSKAALEASKQNGTRGSHLGCSYVFAQACLDLGRYPDGINALERCQHLWKSRNTWNKHSETRRQHLPDAAAVLCLQGKLYQAYKDNSKAVECYVEALKRNPFLWDAFLGLCEMGADAKVPNIYKLTSTMRDMINSSQSEEILNLEKAIYLLTTHSHSHATSSTTKPTLPDLDLSTTTSSSTRPGSNLTNPSALFEKHNGSNVSFSTSTTPTTEGMETPVNRSGSDDPSRQTTASFHAELPLEPPLAPARKHRTVHPFNMDYGLEPPPKMRAAALRSLRTRSRGNAEPEDPAAAAAANSRGAREASASVSSTLPQGERKRNVSGQPVEPAGFQRRSARLGGQGRLAAGSKATTGIPSLASSKEPREIKKIRSTVRSRNPSGTTTGSGSGSSSANATGVGRVVSGASRKAATAAPGAGVANAETAAPETKEKEKEAQMSSLIQQYQQAIKAAQAEKPKEIEAVCYALDMFSQLAGGYLALSRYKCREAIQIFNSLPTAQRDSPWVLSQLGRAYYEQGMYHEAGQYFARVRSSAPFTLDDMEIYSTVLWHLKDEVELAYLAHELMEIDRLSPQAWCAIGNSFSLQQEHDQALKCFKRATQLDPSFAYGFTLQGHEYVSNEEHDKALDAYRSGIAAQPRHYNAWYGLGRVHERLGKFEHAQKHYMAAVAINPSNAVLICCIGLVYERTGQLEDADAQYTRAISLAPQSVLAHLRRARNLLKLHRLEAAHRELLVLKDMAPDEAHVHYLLGKMFKMMREKGSAIKHFTTAMNLDPKAAQFIKEAMETLENPDDEYSDDEDMA